MLDIIDAIKTSAGRVWTRSEERLAFAVLTRARLHGYSAVEQRASDLIVRHNTALVIKYATGISGNNPHYPLEDAIQDGMFGLLRAIDKFIPQERRKFSTYAVPWIRNFIWRGMRRYERIPSPAGAYETYASVAGRMSENLARGMTHQQAVEATRAAVGWDESHFRRAMTLYSVIGVASLDEPVYDEPDASTLGEVIPDAMTLHRADVRMALDALEDVLPESARRIRARYWDGLTPVEIARLEGVSKQAVSSSIRRGLYRLRKMMTEGENVQE